jgi:surface protein
MKEMFYEARGFNQDIGNWDVSQVITVHSMFQRASHFNQDLTGWNLPSGVLSYSFSTDSPLQDSFKPSF